MKSSEFLVLSDILIQDYSKLHTNFFMKLGRGGYNLCQEFPSIKKPELTGLKKQDT